MLEFEIQNRFIEHITGRREIKNPKANRIETYRELVNFRFQEIINNAFPIFQEQVGKERMKELIKGFIAHKPESPYIWQAPLEFIRFIKNHKMAPDLPWAEDLLWYEWTEVDIFMRCPAPDKRQMQFDWKKPWRLSKSAQMRRLKYRVYLNDFEEPGEYPLILYYNYPEEEVHFQEITPFLYDFFHSTRKTALESLHETCNTHKIIPGDLEKLLYDVMQNYIDKKILEAV